MAQCPASGIAIAITIPSGGRAAIDWLDVSSISLVQRLPLGNTDGSQALTRESMTLFENRLWLRPKTAIELLVFYLAQ
jgi:hypothetical protein